MAILLGYSGEQHVPRALESGQLSGHCGLRIWLNGERPVAIDPQRTKEKSAKRQWPVSTRNRRCDFLIINGNCIVDRLPASEATTSSLTGINSWKIIKL